MRLFDKCLTGRLAGYGLHLHAISDRIVVVACDSVASHYAEMPKTGTVNDFAPYCRPPWDVCFLEWNVPQFFVFPNGDRIPKLQELQQVGLLIEKMEGDFLNDAAKRLQLPNDATLHFWTTMYFRVAGEVEISELPCVWSVRDDGWLEKFIFVQTAKNTVVFDETNLQTATIYHHTAFLAISFTNCKNVKLQDVTDDLQPEPKIRRRLKIPDVKRYTLNICGHYTKPSRNVNEPQQGVMPFHLCRGHFATYTADKPMFGNPKLVGRYWHPPHMRGKKENGVIEKDYAIQ